jgi:outer membrane protein assembly factor BamB
MKRLILVFVTIISTSCSFDNKTGIWKDATSTPVVDRGAESILNNEPKTRYESIFTKNKPFNEEIEVVNPQNLESNTPTKLANWMEEYGVPTNNISNYFYNNNKVLLFKSRKLSKIPAKDNYSKRRFVFYKDNLISYDHKGKIFIYSLSLRKKVFEYNFYKKKFKKFNKEIYLIVNENILYAADNLGYLYAFNLDNNSIIWAKNYGIPFRSNLKFSSTQLFLANQDNVVYSINPSTGDKNWEFATSQTFLKSDFINNFSIDLINNNLLFLNTSGELYSINYLSKKINWVLNFKNPSLGGDIELFLSKPTVIKNDTLVITTEKAILSYDALGASRNWNFSAESIFKPIITLNYTYAILKNNLLICLENEKGTVIWSKDIFSNVESKKVIKNFKPVVDFKIVNDKINVYSKNGYLLSFNSRNGNLISESRISKNGISSKVVFLDGDMLFIDNKNKLLKYN